MRVSPTGSPGLLLGMKIHLSEISEDGVERSLRISTAEMPRLTEVLGEQEGMVEASLLMKNHGGNVDVRGGLRAELKAPCQRCLDPVSLDIDEAIQLSLAPLESYAEAEGDLHLGSAELDMSYYEGDTIDLTRLLEDELLLMLPDSVAEIDDEDRCMVCERKMEDLYSSGGDDADDHPFAGMKTLLKGEKD